MGVVKSFVAAIIATILLSSFASAKVNDRDKEYFRQLEAFWYSKVHPPLNGNDELTKRIRLMRDTMHNKGIKNCKVNGVQIVDSSVVCLAKLGEYYGEVKNLIPMGKGIKRLKKYGCRDNDSRRGWNDESCEEEVYYYGKFNGGNRKNDIGVLFTSRGYPPKINETLVLRWNGRDYYYNEWSYSDICKMATINRTSSSVVWQNNSKYEPFVMAARLKSWNCFLTKTEEVVLERKKEESLLAAKAKKKREAQEAERKRNQKLERQRLAQAQAAEEAEKKQQQEIENARLKSCIQKQASSLIDKLPFSERKRFIRECLKDGKGFVEACNCTYFMLKCKGKQSVINNILEYGQVGNLGGAFSFGAEYMICSIGSFLGSAK
jgi:hypothetical protein